MPRLVYYLAASLDGTIADEDGGVDWLPPVTPERDFGYAEFYATVDMLLMGRRTYEQALSFGEWAYADREVRVWTRRPLEDPPARVRAVGGAPADVVAGLGEEGARRVWLVGGTELAEALRAEGLIDEWIVTLVPRTIGEGVPLFNGPVEGMRFVEATPLPAGLLQVRMERS